MRIRIKFRKYGVMKFVGHLDLMRYFQKCMRRGEIDIALSGGFSPHPIMSFALPLGLGVTSDGEYLDIAVNNTKSSEEAVRALNAVMVEGIEILSYRRLFDTDQKAMSAVAAADYTLRFRTRCDVPQVEHEAAFGAFYGQDAIWITKQTKKSEKTLDLKKLIYDARVYREEGSPCFALKVSAGSKENVKPELILEAFYHSLGVDLKPLSIQIHRIDLYGEKDDGFLSLGEMGEDIA